MVKFAWDETPTPSAAWTASSSESRSSRVHRALSQDSRYAFLEVSRTLDDGSVFFFPDTRLAANTRGPTLRAVEVLLKRAVDESLTVWIEPMDDKNALRRLRGVTLVPDGSAESGLPLLGTDGKANN